eukprot:3501321-Alexandrium_andersonii.AAC.1
MGMPCCSRCGGPSSRPSRAMRARWPRSARACACRAAGSTRRSKQGGRMARAGQRALYRL